MTQPEALRLADMLENNYPLEPEAEEAAAELRRLHEENEHLRQALLQPKQEPVAWMDDNGFSQPLKEPPYYIPLYTAPPKREWVGLTRRELDIATLGLEDLSDCYKAIEAKLKEKNT